MKKRTVRIIAGIDIDEDFTVDDFYYLTEEEFEAMDENEFYDYCLKYDMIQDIVDDGLYDVVFNCYIIESDEDDDEED